MKLESSCRDYYALFKYDDNFWGHSNGTVDRAELDHFYWLIDCLFQTSIVFVHGHSAKKLTKR